MIAGSVVSQSRVNDRKVNLGRCADLWDLEPSPALFSSLSLSLSLSLFLSVSLFLLGGYRAFGTISDASAVSAGESEVSGSFLHCDRRIFECESGTPRRSPARSFGERFVGPDSSSLTM